jgi:molybdate transport system substrate-binding protein
MQETVCRIVRGRFAATLCAVISLFAATFLPEASSAADIRVFSSGAPADAEKAIAAKFTQDSGHRVIFTVGTPGAIEDRLSHGEKTDIVVLPAPVIAAMDKAGRLHPARRMNLARVGIGVVVRQGASLPDISTPDAIRTMLLEAHSIVYPDPVGGGVAGVAIGRMIAQLGIADAVKPKTTLMYAIAGGVDLVARGAAEVGLFNISEIITVKGITLVGPLPSALQNYITFTAAVPADNASPEQALDFMKALSDPAAHAHWTAAGLEPLSGGQ